MFKLKNICIYNSDLSFYSCTVLDYTVSSHFRALNFLVQDVCMYVRIHPLNLIKKKLNKNFNHYSCCIKHDINYI